MRGDPASVTEVQEDKAGLPRGDLKKSISIENCPDVHQKMTFKEDQTNLQQVKVFDIMELLSAPLKKITPHLYDSKQGKKSYLKSKKKRNALISGCRQKK